MCWSTVPLLHLLVAVKYSPGTSKGEDEPVSVLHTSSRLDCTGTLTLKRWWSKVHTYYWSDNFYNWFGQLPHHGAVQVGLTVSWWLLPLPLILFPLPTWSHLRWELLWHFPCGIEMYAYVKNVPEQVKLTLYCTIQAGSSKKNVHFWTTQKIRTMVPAQWDYYNDEIYFLSKIGSW